MQNARHADALEEIMNTNAIKRVLLCLMCVLLLPWADARLAAQDARLDWGHQIMMEAYLAASHDGRYVAQTNMNRGIPYDEVTVYDTETGSIVGHKVFTQINPRAFLPHDASKMILLPIVDGEGMMVVWDWRTGEMSTPVPGGDRYPLLPPPVSPDERYTCIVRTVENQSGDMEYSLVIYQLADGAEVYRDDAMQGLAFLDNTTLLVRLADGRLAHFDLETQQIGSIVDGIQLGGREEIVAIDPGHDFIVAAANTSTFKVFQLSAGRLVLEHEVGVVGSWRARGLQTAVDSRGQLSYLRQRQEGSSGHQLTYVDDKIIAVEPDGTVRQLTRVANAAWTRYSADPRGAHIYASMQNADPDISGWGIYRFDLNTDVVDLPVRSHTGINQIRYSSDGTRLLAVDLGYPRYQILNPANGETLHTLGPENHPADLKYTGVIWSRDGKSCYFAADADVERWDIDLASTSPVFSGGGDILREIMDTPDGKYIVGRHLSGFAVWEIGGAESPLYTVQAPAEDARIVAGPGPSQFTWSFNNDAESRRYARTFDASGAAPEPVLLPGDFDYNPTYDHEALIFLPDGRRVAWIDRSEDAEANVTSSIGIADVNSGEVQFEREFAGVRITAVKFTPDGDHMITCGAPQNGKRGSGDQLRVWNWRENRLVRNIVLFGEDAELGSYEEYDGFAVRPDGGQLVVWRRNFNCAFSVDLTDLYKETTVEVEPGNNPDLFTPGDAGGRFPSGGGIELSPVSNAGGTRLSFEFRVKQAGAYRVRLVDLNGNTLLSGNAPNVEAGRVYQYQFDLAGYSTNVYMVQVLGGGSAATQVIQLVR